LPVVGYSAYSCLLSYKNEGHSFYGKSLVRNDDSFKCVEGHMRRKLSATLLRPPHLTFCLQYTMQHCCLLTCVLPPSPTHVKGEWWRISQALLSFGVRPMLILGQSHCPLLHRGPPPICTPTFKVT
jgi:hypothetical protein